jgi:hypothetical protein
MGTVTLSAEALRGDRALSCMPPNTSRPSSTVRKQRIDASSVSTNGPPREA